MDADGVNTEHSSCSRVRLEPALPRGQGPSFVLLSLLHSGGVNRSHETLGRGGRLPQLNHSPGYRGQRSPFTDEKKMNVGSICVLTIGAGRWGGGCGVGEMLFGLGVFR